MVPLEALSLSAVASHITNVSVTLTGPIVTYPYIPTVPLNHSDIDSTVATNVAHSKHFSISFCNIRGLSSNTNSVHQHLQSSNPHALCLTETKLKPLDPNDNSILSPDLKCHGYKLFSSFFPSDGVCRFIRSDVQTFRVTQFDLSSSGFQLIWLKLSFPGTSKFICTLYRSPNSNDHSLLFNHQSKSIDTIILQSPPSEIIIPGDLNVYNSDWLGCLLFKY